MPKPVGAGKAPIPEETPSFPRFLGRRDVGDRPQEAKMSKAPSETGPEKDTGDRANAALDRRSFLTTGAAVGAVAAMPTQPAEAADGINWDREVDVVVIGAGAGGLTAAIAACEKGASVLIVEKNFDIGGRAMMSS